MALHTRGALYELHTGRAEDVAWDLEPGSVSTIVTSPPYFGLRDYGAGDQIGQEDTLQQYIDALVATFGSLHSALADDGTLWLNLGDGFAGKANGGASYEKHRSHFQRPEGHLPGRRNTTSEAPYKSLLGVPWRVAFALQEDGWLLRDDIVWAKPNPMPESVKDRPVRSHEFLFMLTKGPRYFFDHAAAREPASGRASGNRRHKQAEAHEAAAGGIDHRAAGLTDGQTVYETRTIRDVWTVAASTFREAHFATWPVEIPRRCIAMSSRPNDVVLDPFSGSATTGMAALELGRRYVGIDVNAEYHDLAVRTRLAAA